MFAGTKSGEGTIEILDCLDDCTIHHHTYNSPCGQGSCHRCSPKQCLAIHVAIESGAISYQEWRPKKRSWDHHVHVWLQSFRVGWCVPKCHPKVQHAHRAQTILDCTHHWSNWWSSGLQRALDSIQHQFEAYWTNHIEPISKSHLTNTCSKSMVVENCYGPEYHLWLWVSHPMYGQLWPHWFNHKKMLALNPYLWIIFHVKFHDKSLLLTIFLRLFLVYWKSV